MDFEKLNNEIDKSIDLMIIFLNDQKSDKEKFLKITKNKEFDNKEEKKKMIKIFVCEIELFSTVILFLEAVKNSKKKCDGLNNK